MAGILNLFIGVSGVVRDAFFNLVTLLLPSSQTQFWNSDASTNKFNLVVNGDARPTTASPYYTMWSAYFDGSGDSFSVSTSTVLDLNGAINFTIEAWVYLTGYGSSSDMSLSVANKFTGAGGLGYTYGIIGGGANQGKIQFYGANGSVSIVSTNVVPLNSWNHVAIVKNGTTYTHYLNGVANGSQTTATTLTASANALVIGDYGYSDDFLGYMSNLRITKNGAVYTSNFTPPTSPLTTSVSAGTVSLLTFQSNRFVDNSSNGFTLTPSGTPSVSSFSPFTEANQNIGSGYFDGTTDYITTPTGQTALTLNTDDFTIEGYFYPTTQVQTDPSLFASTPLLAMTNGILVQFGGSTGSIALFVNNTRLTASSTNNFIGFNQWNHIAVCRTGGNTYGFYINGVAVNNVATNSTSITTNSWLIGYWTVGGNAYAGYVTDFRIIKGTALYTTNFTPPTAPLTAVANTSLLTLQYALSNNSSGFVDQSTNRFPLTRNGNVAQGSFSPYSQTGWSNYFVPNAYFTIPASANFLFTGDVTLEAWIIWDGTESNGGREIYATGGSGSADQWGIFSGLIYFGGVFSTSGPPINQWVHIAVTRSGSTVRHFINGVLSGSGTNASSIGSNSATAYIGFRSDGFHPWFGYISNLRILNGTALYTSNFTPPITPLTAITNTVLLTCASNRFIDTNTQVAAKTLTVTGNLTVQPFSPFLPTVSYTTTGVGGSIYQDGSGDYINGVNNQPAMALGSGDWTVECWVYPVGSTTYSGERGFLQISPSSGGLSTSYSNGIFLGFRSTSGVYYGVNGSLPVGGTTSLNQWIHVAMTRASGTVRGWLNGVQVASYSETSTLTGNNLVIGGYYNTSYLLNGYISDVRIVKGTAVYTGTFTPPTAPLSASGAASASAYPSTANVNTSFSSTNTSLLCNFNNAGIYDASTKNNLETFDSSGLSTLRSQFGGSSIFFDGTGDALYIPTQQKENLRFGTGDFTIEFWAWKSADGSTSFDAVISVGSTGNYFGGFAVELSANRGFGFIYDGAVRIGSSLNPNDSTWHHYAVVRSGNTFALYRDGVQLTTATLTPTLGITGEAWIGSGVTSTGNNFNGYLDNLRVTRGVARYTSNFAVPSAPFPTQ